MFEESRLIKHLDKMLDNGINGPFEQDRRKLQELVSDISHQTKTPLANILLYSQLLQEKNMDDECHQLVDEIRQQSKKKI